MARPVKGIPLVPLALPLRLGSGPTTVSYYVDLACSDCADHWPGLRGALAAYRDRVTFEVYVMPLPYFDSSFILAKAVRAVMEVGNPEAVLTFMDNVFNNQAARVGNAAVADKLLAQVAAELPSWALEGTGVDPEAFTAAFTATTAARAARAHWKVCASQGVCGTPTTFINGVQVADLASAEEWGAALEPLL